MDFGGGIPRLYFNFAQCEALVDRFEGGSIAFILIKGANNRTLGTRTRVLY